MVRLQLDIYYYRVNSCSTGLKRLLPHWNYGYRKRKGAFTTTLSFKIGIKFLGAIEGLF